jgi:3-hydroxyisobutyrate dehydrogenase-like beta-hydroxyacid dehydrogenase
MTQWVKDADLISAFARELGVATPLLDVARDLYRRAAESGMADWDSAAVFEVLDQMSQPQRLPGVGSGTEEPWST